MIRNEKYPWAHASLDGELTDQDSRKGILEIKTTNILQSMQREKMERSDSGQLLHTGVALSVGY